MRWGGTSRMPSGFARWDASFATNFVPASPTEAGRPVRSRTRSRIARAISTGGPKSRTVPATSRNASSMLSGSTSGVNSWKTAITVFDALRYFAYTGSTSTSCGQSCFARATGMAERTPKRRAS